MKNSNPKQLVVVTGFTCNNNCVLCSLRPQALIHKNKNTQEIEAMLASAAKKGLFSAEFTGGEPTLRKDLLHLIRYAKKIGFRNIAIGTNGRLLSYKVFLNDLIDAGLNQVTITLFSHKELIHDSITRTPGSFKQTVTAINNIIQEPSIQLSVNTVVCQFNYKLLDKTGVFLYKTGVKHWGILDLIPFGNADKLYMSLVVKLDELSIALNKLENIVGYFQSVLFFDFPYCLFNQETRNHPNIKFFDAQERVSTFKQIGYRPARFGVEKKDIYNDVHKRRIAICNNCYHNKNCAGFWQSYLHLYGESFKAQVIKKAFPKYDN